MRLPSVVGDRRVLIVFVLVALAASACGLLLRDIDPDEGGAIYNDTDETVFIYTDMADGGEIRLGGVQAATTGSVQGPCQDGPLSARHADDESIIDTWEGSLCRGDYWSIPKGGLVENRTSRTIGVRAVEPGSGIFYSIRIEAGGKGSMRTPCADPPITASGDSFEASPLEEALCVGDVWVLEEP